MSTVCHVLWHSEGHNWYYWTYAMVNLTGAQAAPRAWDLSTA